MNKVINRHGYEVVAQKKAKLHFQGSFCKVGDTVYPAIKFNTVDAPELSTPLVVKLIWKNKYATVLEFENTNFSAASTFFKF